MRINEDNKGFTLIELVIVIVILGVLAMLVIPQVGNYTENAKKATCESNVKMLQSAADLYKTVQGTTINEIDDLLGSGNIPPYIDAAPKCPYGTDHEYRIVSGKVNCYKKDSNTVTLSNHN